MTNQSKSPVFWCFILFVAGLGLGIWGMIKADCGGGPGCWKGSGFLMWAGGLLIVGGIIGWAILSNTRRNR